MSQTKPVDLFHESPAELPGRIAASAEAVSGCKVGVYVIDIDGSCLIRLAGDGVVFPERIKAPVGVGPEIALEQLPALQQICTRGGRRVTQAPARRRDDAAPRASWLLVELKPRAEARPLPSMTVRDLARTSAPT